MIILYDKNKTKGFDRNDLVLRNVTKCEVTWEKNGQFQIDLVYPIVPGDTVWQSIVKGAIVKCPVAYQQDQLFRLNTPSKKMDENSGYFYIEATGYHITYDLNDNFLEDVRPTNKTGIEAGQYILANTQYFHPFTWIGDIADINTAYYIRKNPINALVGDDDNSYLNRWGGELVRDNFNIGMFKQAGQNRGVVIKYSKNLTGFEQSGDDSNLMTRCMPYCTIDTSSTDTTATIDTDTNTDEDLKPVLKLPEKYIDSPLINNYSHPYVKAVQVDLTEDQQKLGDLQKYPLMREYVNNLYNNNHIDVPVYSYAVNFVDLATTEEYKDYAILEEVHPYDLITVKALDIDVIAELVGYTYDSLTKQYEAITLGNIQNDIIRNNQKSLFQISKQNEQDIKILQAQLGGIPDSIQPIVESSAAGGNNLFDHSDLDKYASEWSCSGASPISTTELQCTDKVWEIPNGGIISKSNIITNPNMFNGQQLTLSYQTKCEGITTELDMNGGITSSASISLNLRFRANLVDSSYNWIENAEETGVINVDFVPVEPNTQFAINNPNNYVFILHGYDASDNFVVDFSNSTSIPAGIVNMKVEIISSGLTPETLGVFSITENDERTLTNFISMPVTGSDMSWNTEKESFYLQTGNVHDILTGLDITCQNNSGTGTLYTGAFMINTGSTANSFSQSSNDTVETLRAHQIIADYISAKQADIDQLHATNATIDTLSSTYATITNLNAVNANVGNLKASVGNIMDLTTNTLKANVVTATSIQTGAITAGSGIIATGAIQTAQIADDSVTDAKIVTLTANKLTAGTIDASKITVTNLDCANLTVGTINGQQIAAGAITATQLANGAVGTSQLTTDINNTIQNAYSTANAASSTASSALTSANGKNKTFYGSTTPTGMVQGDLWMQPVSGGISPMQYNGTTWVSITDVAAINAQTTATNATTLANNALNTVNNLQIGGVNLISNGNFKQGLVAGSLTAPTSWTFLGGACVFINQGVTNYTSLGTIYIAHPVTSSCGIASDSLNLIVGNQYTVSFASIRENNIASVDNHIECYDASNNLQTITLNYDYSKAGTKQSFTFTVPLGTVHSRFVQNAVWNNTGSGGYLTTLGYVKLEIGNKATDWTPSLADTQDAGYLLTGTLLADRIAANTITGTKIASNTITAANLVAGCITSASGVVGALDAGAITTGTLSADRIGAETITVDKLLVGDIQNYLGKLNSPAWLVTAGEAGFVEYPSGSGQMHVCAGADAWIECQNFVQVNPGDQFYWTCSSWAATNATGNYWFQICCKSSADGSWDINAAQNNQWSVFGGANSGYFTVPSGVSKITVHLFVPANAQIIEPILRKVTTGTLIQDGAITTSKIVSSAITTDKIAAGAVQASNILSNTITANQIAANTITATQIASRTITADRIVTGAITANEIAASTITGTKIAGNTITAGNILAGTLTSASGVFGAISASNITAGTMAADRISGGTLTLGGSTSGQLVIKDASNNIISQQDVNGILQAQGAFRMLESTGNQFTIGSFKNLISDGSFESLGLNGTGNLSNGTLIDYNMTPNDYWTIYSGNPKVICSDTSSATAPPLGVKFGTKAVVTTSADVIRKIVPFAGYNKTFTISGYVCSSANRNTAGSPVNAVITVNVINSTAGDGEVSGNGVVETFTQTLNITSSHTSGSTDATKRITLTFTTPPSTTYYDTIKIYLSSGSSSQWVVWDGMQLIEGSYPTMFMEQDQDIPVGSMGTSGYTIINVRDNSKGIIPLIIQWGTVVIGGLASVSPLYSASGNVVFHIPFPNHLIGLTGNAPSYKYWSSGYTSVTSTGAVLNMFSVDSSINGAVAGWWAVGY